MLTANLHAIEEQNVHALEMCIWSKGRLVLVLHTTDSVNTDCLYEMTHAGQRRLFPRGRGLVYLDDPLLAYRGRGSGRNVRSVLNNFSSATQPSGENKNRNQKSVNAKYDPTDRSIIVFHYRELNASESALKCT